MKLATARSESPDGTLLMVSRGLKVVARAAHIAPTLQNALERWEEVSPALQKISDELNAGRLTDTTPYDAAALVAPLPRSWQWLDGSAFPSHGALMQKAFDMPPIASKAPLMYQGMSHSFLGPREDVPFMDAADDIDFEAELGIITAAVPMGIDVGRALDYVRLAVLINDWSLRAIAPIEMKTGFGWIQAKPACSMAPVAVTLDELGDAWTRGRIMATLQVQRGSMNFGRVPSTEMAFGFDELIAHAARTRELCAGTIIGSGTVSSSSYAEVGSCCIAERRAIEMIESGAPRTPFLAFGERIRITAKVDAVDHPPFGDMDQVVVNRTR
jgi:fumarylacetoacetate (FAA) hydrolase